MDIYFNHYNILKLFLTESIIEYFFKSIKENKKLSFNQFNIFYYLTVKA